MKMKAVFEVEFDEEFMISEEYTKLHLEKKDQILTQRIIIKQEQEINRLNNIIDELEKWLNEYYESNRKWYNTELSNQDRKYYEREYRNTEFMIVKFKKQLNELKGDNK